MEKPTSVSEQLILLKNITKLTGALHEAQLEQMKYWLYALIKDPIIFEIQIAQEKQQVTYLIKSEADIKENLSCLNNWIKWLLGEEWEVKVQINGKRTKKSTSNKIRRKAASRSRTGPLE